MNAEDLININDTQKRIFNRLDEEKEGAQGVKDTEELEPEFKRPRTKESQGVMDKIGSTTGMMTNHNADKNAFRIAPPVSYFQ